MQNYQFPTKEQEKKLDIASNTKQFPSDMTTVEDVGAESKTVVRAGLAQILKRGIIMDVLDAEQAQTVEEAGPCVVEKVSTDKWRDPGAADLKVLGIWGTMCHKHAHDCDGEMRVL